MVYAGKRLVNQSNGALLAFAVIMVFNNIRNHDDGTEYALFSVAAVFIVYLFVSINSFYFKVTSKQLIAKNYLLPILKFKYIFADIESVEILRSAYFASSPARLRVVMADKKSFAYLSGSLGIDDWRLMVDELRSLDVKVVNTNPDLQNI